MARHPCAFQYKLKFPREENIMKECEIISSVDGSISSTDRKKNSTFSDYEDSYRDGPWNVTEEDIILSVCWRRGKLGAAYYKPYETELHLLEDVVDVHPDFKNMRCLLNQVQFSKVIASAGLSDAFKTALRDAVLQRDISGNNDECHESIKQHKERAQKLHFIAGKNADFGYEPSRRRILGYHFGFEPKFCNEGDRLLLIGTQIDLKKENMVVSLGLLFKYLENYVPQITLNRDAFRIGFVVNISLENTVLMDEDTYKALQVFNPVPHPSAFKRSYSGSAREGLSVFGIFNRCKSTIGSRRMREIFTNPINRLDELNFRLDAVEFCCKKQHGHIIRNITSCIGKVKSVTGLLASIYRSRFNMNHWKSLYSSLYNAILIGQICSNYSTHSPLFIKIFESVTKNVHEAAHYISHIIDFEESFLTNQFSVRIGIDDRLDRLRETYAQVPRALEKVAEIELKDLPEHIRECTIVYLPEMGYLLSIPLWKERGRSLRDYELPNFQLKFTVKNYAYYKTPRCIELDDILGDMLAAICGIESKIMVALIQYVHERSPDIIKMIRLIAELDCIIAMASIAVENNYTRPHLTEEGKLEITRGRHPLQELCVDNFIPNDAKFSVENGAIKILTGPNASGKSVYLKQVAIIAFLGHIGSFVPAKEAVIGILSHIHSRIHTFENISTRMSAFALDLKQLSRAMYNSTPNSLILIDEFGKGTTEVDGLSLLTASLIHFIDRGNRCPFLVVSTHFHQLPKLLPRTALVELQYFDYCIEDNEVIYLYRLKNGSCGVSLAHVAVNKTGFGEKSRQRIFEISSRSDGKIINCDDGLEITKRMKR